MPNPLRTMWNISKRPACEWKVTESHDEALLEMVNQVRTKLLGAEIMVGLKKLDLPGIDLTAAKQMAHAALYAIQQGSLGYAIICAAKG